MLIKNITDIYCELHNCVNNSEYIYIIIEGSGSNNVAKEKLLYEHSNTSYIPIYSATNFENLLHISPLLVFTKDDDYYFNWFLKEGFMLGSGILLVGSCNKKNILNHMQNLLEVILPSYNIAAFRYYDPLVLDRFVNCVDEKTKISLLGPLSAMYWPKRLPKQGSDDGWLWKWRKISRPHSGLETPATLHFPIRITDEQIEAFTWNRYQDISLRLKSFMYCRKNILNATSIYDISEKLKILSYTYGFYSEDEIMHAWNIIEYVETQIKDDIDIIKNIFSDNSKFTTLRINSAYSHIMNSNTNCDSLLRDARIISKISSNQKSIKFDTN